MSVRVITGNLFASRCQTLVNTVNCVGVMGAGVALECRLRYPEMYDKYVRLCDKKQINIGVLWIYKGSDRWIMNFPTKKNWKYPSKIEYLHAGLEKFMRTYKEREVESIAFPLLGADKGGIPQNESMDVMTTYLENVDIEVEIYKYDAKAKDDLYEKTKTWLLSQDIRQISEKTKIRKDRMQAVIDALQSPNIVQLNQLASVKGVGIVTLERIFDLARNTYVEEHSMAYSQRPLF